MNTIAPVLTAALRSKPMDNRKRVKALNVRMTDAELAMVAELAEHNGLTVSDTIRLLVRQAHRKEGLGGRRSSKPKRKR